MTRCSPRPRSRAPTASLSRHKPAPSGASGCASAPESASTCAPRTLPRPSPMRWPRTPAVRRARGAPGTPRGRPHRHLRGRRQPSPLLRPARLLDPHRRFRPPGPREPARLRNRRAALALGAGGAGHAHRPRRPAGQRPVSRELRRRAARRFQTGLRWPPGWLPAVPARTPSVTCPAGHEWQWLRRRPSARTHG